MRAMCLPIVKTDLGLVGRGNVDGEGLSRELLTSSLATIARWQIGVIMCPDSIDLHLNNKGRDILANNIINAVDRVHGHAH